MARGCCQGKASKVLEEVKEWGKGLLQLRISLFLGPSEVGHTTKGPRTCMLLFWSWSVVAIQDRKRERSDGKNAQVRIFESIATKLTSTGTYSAVLQPQTGVVSSEATPLLKGRVARDAQTYHQSLVGLHLFDVRALFPPEQRHQVNNTNVVTSRANGCREIGGAWPRS